MIDDVQRETRERMDGAIKSLTHDLTSIRTGRANPAILEHVQVEYFGTPTAINQLAVITVPEPRLIAIRPFSAGDIGAISKALMKSDLGLTPTNDGKLIRLAIPPLTDERRRDLSRQVSRRVEEARVAVRNIRRDANEHLKKLLKDKEVGEDEERRAQDEVQKYTDRFVAEIDKALQAKEADLLAV